MITLDTSVILPQCFFASIATSGALPPSITDVAARVRDQVPGHRGHEPLAGAALAEVRVAQRQVDRAALEEVQADVAHAITSDQASRSSTLDSRTVTGSPFGPSTTDDSSYQLSGARVP